MRADDHPCDDIAKHDGLLETVKNHRDQPSHDHDNREVLKEHYRVHSSILRPKYQKTATPPMIITPNSMEGVILTSIDHVDEFAPWTDKRAAANTSSLSVVRF